MTESHLSEYKAKTVPNAIHWGGKDLVYISRPMKTIIAKEVLGLLKPHVIAGHMVQQTINGLIGYMEKGLAAVVISRDLGMLGFAKLYPYPSEDASKPPLGYEFSTWLAKYPQWGIGDQILVGALKAFMDQENFSADLFAVCSSANTTPQVKLIAAGGVIMDRPSYVPNMLAAQSGAPHQETCINLKPLLFK